MNQLKELKQDKNDFKKKQAKLSMKENEYLEQVSYPKLKNFDQEYHGQKCLSCKRTFKV